MALGDPVGAPAGRDRLTEALEARIGYRFADAGLLAAALTHPSAQDPKAPGERFERLEFLGDRVLGLIVAELLLTTFPDESEGALTKRFAGLVRRETLVEVAEAIGLGQHLRTVGEQSGTRENLLADGCEALIAALYLDGGAEVARRFVRSEWEPLMRATRRPPRDAKTALQEWLQGRGRPLPSYVLVGQSGPPHNPVFTVEVRADGMAPATGSGPSKRVAEQEAAAVLLAGLEGGG